MRLQKQSFILTFLNSMLLKEKRVSQQFDSPAYGFMKLIGY